MEHENRSGRHTHDVVDDVVNAPSRVPAAPRSPTVQRRLAVGAADDLHEREADEVADRVVRALERPAEHPPLVGGPGADSTRIRRAPEDVTGGGDRRVADGGGSRIRRAAVPVPIHTHRSTPSIQRVASVYKSSGEIKTMSLREFDNHAKAQADWATSARVISSKEPLRELLALARDNNGMVLGGCGDFNVGELLIAGRYPDLTAYARAANPLTWGGTIHITATAANPAVAVEWGKAIRDLEAGIGGLIIERVIPQRAGVLGDGLKRLVDAGAVTDLVDYFTSVKPLLDANNGMEVVSFLAFRGEGGPAKCANYRAALPEIRNYHRFTVTQLNLLDLNKKVAATNATSVTPLPISVVLQSAFDYNGAFHRDPFMTKVIGRPKVLTLVSEGKASLGEFGADLARFATFGVGGKVDEVMLSGHGNAKRMELAGNKGVGKNTLGQTIYGEAAKEEVTVDPSVQQTARDKANVLINRIKAVLRDDPSSRVVLNACLTASNSVVKELDDDPTTAAKQVKEAIAADPSLATAMQAKLGAHQGQVLGANASFGQVGLLDTQDRLDIISATDKKLTASKLEYAEAGTEPTGVLRATLEAWATNKAATIDALNRRLVATKDQHDWDETVIRSLLKVVVANPDNGGLINKFATAAGVLGHLDAPEKCRAGPLKIAVPSAHVDAVFTELTTAAKWTNAAYDHIPLVVHQVWCAHDVAKAGAFLGFLDGSTFDTRSAGDYLDLDVLAPRLGTLLASPSPTPPRGAFLIALSHFIGNRVPAPLAIDYIKGVVGKGGVTFPPTSNVGAVLKGKGEHAVLLAAGVVKKGTAPKTEATDTAVRPGDENVDPTRSGVNTVAVESVTKRAETYGWSDTNAYALPSGKKLGGIPSGTRLHVIGETRGGTKAFVSLFDDPDITLYAVEYTIGSYKTVFVRTKDVKVV